MAVPAAVCLIVKDELQDIAEWVAHYTLLGFERLFINDNGSTDGTREMLSALTGILPVTLIDWPDVEGIAPQLVAYDHCLAACRGRFEWLCFLDADEFLVPPSGWALADLLAEHAAHDAFALNWLTFGSSDLPDTGGRMIVECFVRRGLETFAANRNVKMFVRPERAERALNPHFVQTASPCHDVFGAPIAWTIPGVVEPGGIVQGEWRLHHYFIRSHAHWARKIGRDYPDRAPRRRPEEFAMHDVNEVLDTTGLAGAARVGAFIEAMQIRPLVDRFRRL